MLTFKKAKWITATLMLLSYTLSFAAISPQKIFHPRIILTGIKALQPQEKRGDEIYFLIKYEYKNKVFYYTVPGYKKYFKYEPTPHPASLPTGAREVRFWPHEALVKIRNTPLWKGTLRENDQAGLMISLMEHDIPIWNLDDRLGTIKINFSTTAEKLTYEFVSISNIHRLEKKPTINGSKYTFLVKSKGAEYEVRFLIKN